MTRCNRCLQPVRLNTGDPEGVQVYIHTYTMDENYSLSPSFEINFTCTWEYIQEHGTYKDDAM